MGGDCHETGRIPFRPPIVEHQPYVPRNGWTMGEYSAIAAYYHVPELPVAPAPSEFDTLVARARKLLAELGDAS